MLLKLHVYFILIGERTLQMFVCLFSILNKKNTISCQQTKEVNKAETRIHIL